MGVGFKAVAAGLKHSLVLTTAGEVYGWGAAKACGLPDADDGVRAQARRVDFTHISTRELPVEMLIEDAQQSLQQPLQTQQPFQQQQQVPTVSVPSIEIMTPPRPQTCRLKCWS